MSYDERTYSETAILSETLTVNAIIDEETPLFLVPSTVKQIYTPHDEDNYQHHSIESTGSQSTLIGDENEQDPLLQKSLITPLPWSQLLILLSLQLSEPLSSQIINPFVVEVCFLYPLNSPLNLIRNCSS